MTRILRFEFFNEGWFSSFFGSDDRPYDDDLADYDIERESVNKHRMEFFHDDRLVAIVELDEENISYSPNWLLTILLYESETPKRNFSYEQAEEIKKQKEQPYGKVSKQMGNDSEDAVNSFVKWWSKYTKSGRLNNPLYEV